MNPLLFAPFMLDECLLDAGQRQGEMQRVNFLVTDTGTVFVDLHTGEISHGDM